MRQAGSYILLIGFLFLGGDVATRGAAVEKSATAPDFQEVYDLIRAHLVGVNAAELNRTAVDSLVSALNPRVSINGADQKAPAGSGPPVKKSSLFDGPIAYIQVAQVEEGLPEAVRQAYDQISTNRINGVVILPLCSERKARTVSRSAMTEDAPLSPTSWTILCR